MSRPRRVSIPRGTGRIWLRPCRLVRLRRRPRADWADAGVIKGAAAEPEQRREAAHAGARDRAADRRERPRRPATSTWLPWRIRLPRTSLLDVRTTRTAAVS